MIRKLTPIAGLLAILAGCWFAVGRSETPADLTYINPSGIHTLDPARMSWTADFRVALNLWEGLTTWDPQTLLPVAGAAYLPPAVSDDGLTHTFSLRRDARWSNGEPVTSYDFVRGWRRGLEPGTATDYTFLLTDHIAGAVDYVAFRRRAVAALTALTRLAWGWSIDSRQAQALAAHSIYEEIEAAWPQPTRRPDPDETEAGWRDFATELSAAPIDWETFHVRLLRRHAASLDEEFAGVGIKAPSSHSLVVTLAAPCPYLLDLTAMPIFLPVHESIERLRRRSHGLPITPEGLVAYVPQWTKPAYHINDYPGLVTNGAYRLADWVFKRRLRMEANPHYHGASDVSCRTVDMLVHSSVSASLMSYERGAVDFLPSMTVPYDHEIARLARTGERPDFHLCNVMATQFLNFNCAGGVVLGRENPFGDARVRRAFALAVDKRQLVQRVLGRGDRIAHSFVPPGTITGYEPPRGLRHDADRARELLAEAGFAGGAGLPTIDLLCTHNDSKVMEALASMWEETLGVRVELRGKESRTFAEDKAHQRFMVARGNWYADYNDPTTFLNCLQTGNGNNDSAYASAAYDALLAAASRERDPARRSALLREAETMIVERDLPILPILFYSEPIAISPRVSGLYPNARLWFPFRYARVSP